MWILIFQRILIEFVLDVIRFPYWWYTAGARNTLIGLWNFLGDVNRSLAPGLWLKNLFVPMFGQTDWQGRLTSVFIRFVNVIGRTFALGVTTFFLCILFLVWICFPVGVGYLFFLSFFA